MSFFMGLAGGVAEGATRTINTILDKREEEASAARKYMQQRNIQKSEKYESDKVEMESLMKGFAELTGGDLDKAAQLIKGSGNIERASARLELLSSERLKNADFDINKTFEFAQAQTGSGDPYVIGDYVESLVKRPELSEVKTSKKFGLGLADKFLPEAEKIALAGPSGRTIDIGAARMMPGTTTVAEEYARGKESDILSLENARLNNQRLMKEIGEIGALDVSQVKQSFATMVAGGLNRNKIPASVDTSGNVSFDLKDAGENFAEIKDAYTDALKSITEDAISTNALGVEGMKSMLKTNAMQTLNYTEETLPSPKGPEEMVTGELYDTKAGIILYVGTGDGFDEDDYIVIKKPE